MESHGNQKSVKQIKIYFIFEILQITILRLDDSFAHSWHSLNQLHEVVTWNAFQLTGATSIKFIYGIDFLLKACQQIEGCAIQINNRNIKHF